jgi:uncharacterized protein (TIGR02452 family)
MNSLDRLHIWNDTVQYCDNATYYTPESIKYTNIPFPDKVTSYKTSIRVLNYDCLECGIKFEKLNPVVLNLADCVFPGGAVASGSGAQEESIFRATDIQRTLHLQTGYYPLKDIETIYSPSVRVIKNRDGTYKSHPNTVAVITAPGIRMPILKDGKMTNDDMELLRRKIRMILNIAYKHNHKCVVLGAMGCGAWRNPPKCVAKCFKEVLPEYDGMFRCILFAVLKVPQNEYLIKTVNKHTSNYRIFKNIIQDNLT